MVLTGAEHPVGGVEGVIVIAPGPAQPLMTEGLEERCLGIGDARPAALEERGHGVLEATAFALAAGIH